MYLFVDTETGGFNPVKNSIVEIGAILCDEKMRIFNTFNIILKPYVNKSLKFRVAPDMNSIYTKQAEKVHGLSIQDLKDHGVEDGLDQFGEFINSCKNDFKFVCGHVVEFDLRFLNNKVLNSKRKIDSKVLAKSKLKLDGYSLDRVCKKLKIENPMEHSAMGDAISSYLVVCKLKGFKVNDQYDFKNFTRFAGKQ